MMILHVVCNKYIYRKGENMHSFEGKPHGFTILFKVSIKDSGGFELGSAGP